MPTAEINGHSLFYREYGEPSAPPLVMVHGLHGESGDLAPVAERLAESFRVVTPDMLGHGESAHPEEFVLEDQGHALNGLIASLGYGSAAVLGHSMGSYVAAQAAVLEPARVSKLVLVAPKAHGLTSSSAAYAERMGFDLAGASARDALEFMAGALWSPDTSDDRRTQILLSLGSDPASPEEKAAVERSLAGFDLRPRLGGITSPTLVVSGSGDGLNTPEMGREVAVSIPDFQFRVYEHSGHMLPYEETDRLVADVTHFVLG
ncbi:alpha/beta hydrolase [Nocardiopsis sp. NPDC006139]|uniref:alpha/beta fold hydrolase n=1 Tax=unclassified Nocardiopsis TaxID=2649073 RepID=UPI0015992367|nr:alpha/beta hydrolase [Nocardiopsis flavescens]